MIIVEGPDGAGKTNLVNRIELDWGITREARAVSAEAKALVPIGQYIEGELAKGFSMRIYDRFALISSPMYIGLPNRTFRDELCDIGWLTEMHHKFQKIDPVIILCLPPLEVVKANVLKDETQNAVVQDTIEDIYWNYHNWLCYQQALPNGSVLHYDYTQQDPLKLAALLRWANARTLKGR